MPKRKKTPGSYPRKATTHNLPVLTYLTVEQVEQINKLAAATQRAKTTLFREAVEDLLAKYKRKGGRK